MTLKEYIIKGSEMDGYSELAGNIFITALDAQGNKVAQEVPMYNVSKDSFLWGWKVTDGWMEFAEEDDKALLIIVVSEE
jgi:hypothetical protein